jgi:hypothetical protein
VKEVCELYKAAQELKESGVGMVSVDEKTGIQALERAAETKPLRAGEVEKQETEYIRHGTRVFNRELLHHDGQDDCAKYRRNENRGRFCEAHQADARNKSESRLDIPSRPAKHAQIRGFGKISGE